MKYKTLVINLDGSDDRWTSISQQCQRLELPTQRVSAVRGSALSVAEKREVYNETDNLKQYDKILNDGEIGCYLSHVRCWQQIVEQQLDFALILEDDAHLVDSIQDCIRLLGNSHQQWDYIKLSGGSKQKQALDSMPLTSELSLKRVLKLPSTTTGQLVSLAGAQKLLAKAFPIVRPIDIDIQFWFEKALRCFVVSPYPVLNGQFGSEINETNDRRETKRHPFRRLSQRFGYEVKLRQYQSSLPPFPKISDQ